jgi:cytochrome P450
VVAQHADAALEPAWPGLPPGPAIPLLLQALRWVQWPIPFLDECAREFGDAFTLRLPGRPPLVMVSHPDAIRELFTGDVEDLRAGEANVVLEPLLGKHSLLLLDGAEHLRERRMLQPPFHGERMQSYGETMQQIARRAIDAWPVGRPFPIHAEMQSITLDVILRTVFGLDKGPKMDALRAELVELLGVSASPQIRSRRPGRRQSTRRRGAAVRGAQARRRAAVRRDRAPPRAAGRGGEDVLSLLLSARDEDGSRCPIRAPRRADHPAGRRTRDHHDVARLGRGPRARPPRGPGAARGELRGVDDPLEIARLDYPTPSARRPCA